MNIEITPKSMLALVISIGIGFVVGVVVGLIQLSLLGSAGLCKYFYFLAQAVFYFPKWATNRLLKVVKYYLSACGEMYVINYLPKNILAFCRI